MYTAYIMERGHQYVKTWVIHLQLEATVIRKVISMYHTLGLTVKVKVSLVLKKLMD